MPRRGVRQTSVCALAAALCLSAAAIEHPAATPERRALVSSTPQYPVKARNQRVEGDVTVCYTIDARGKVRRPYVKKTSNRVFNQAALRAARAIVYEAAAPDAANERAPACSTYRFRLQPQDQDDD